MDGVQGCVQQERWGHDPSAASAFAYTSMKMILQAIEAARGDVSDKTALVDAMFKDNMSEDPRGPITLASQSGMPPSKMSIFAKLPRIIKDELYNKGIWTVERQLSLAPTTPLFTWNNPLMGTLTPLESAPISRQKC